MEISEVFPLFEKQACACIIFNDKKDQICLIKRRDVPVWVLPGGGIDPGEKPEKCAQREAQEELGVNCQLKRLVGIYFPKNSLSRKTFLYELESLDAIQDLPTDETLGAKFFSIKKLPTMPPPYKEWILDALKTPKGCTLYRYVPGVHWGNFIKLLILHPIKVLRFVLSRLGMHWNS